MGDTEEWLTEHFEGFFGPSSGRTASQQSSRQQPSPSPPVRSQSLLSQSPSSKARRVHRPPLPCAKSSVRATSSQQGRRLVAAASSGTPKRSKTQRSLGQRAARAQGSHKDTAGCTGNDGLQSHALSFDAAAVAAKGHQRRRRRVVVVISSDEEEGDGHGGGGGDRGCSSSGRGATAGEGEITRAELHQQRGKGHAGDGHVPTLHHCGVGNGSRASAVTETARRHTGANVGGDTESADHWAPLLSQATPPLRSRSQGTPAATGSSGASRQAKLTLSRTTSSNGGKRRRVASLESWGKPTSSTTASGSQQQTKIQQLWVDKHPPTVDELAVHKKKVAEVKAWLDQALKPTEALNYPGHKILLLTGPPGAGKTATVRALCSSMDLEVVEWINPVRLTTTFDFDHPSGRASFQESATSQLRGFLKRSEAYPTLKFSATNTAPHGKVLLLEDIPNAMLREPSQFHDLLRDFAAVSRFPMVIIVSDENHKGSQMYKLLPPQLYDVASGGIMHRIHFKTVAATILTKAVKRIAQLERLDLLSAERSLGFTLDAVVNVAQGDVRSAINTLQFQATGCKRLAGKTTWGSKRGSKSKRSKSTDTPADASAPASSTDRSKRDVPLDLFHAIGKLLHVKRQPENPHEDGATLPAWRSDEARAQLKFTGTPEAATERSGLSVHTLAAFLHENYEGFFTSIDEMADAMEHLSCADLLTADWAHLSSGLEGLALSSISRGFLHANHHPAPGSWRPMRRPRQREVTLQATEQWLEVACLPAGPVQSGMGRGDKSPLLVGGAAESALPCLWG